MTPPTDVWKLVHRQRLDLADTLTGLDPETWDTPSLCAGWAVRDVVGHLVGIAEGAMSVRRALPRMIRSRFSVDVFLDGDARARGRLEPPELLRRLRQAAGSTSLPPGQHPAGVLTDLVVHTQDVALPLGITCPASPQALLTALGHSVPKGPPLRTRERAAGLFLRASDIEWSWGGNGAPEVTGPAQALLLALCGRPAGLAALSGPGTVTLASRCPAAAGAGSG